MLSPMPFESREHRIRQLFDQLGPMTTADTAKRCVDAGIFSEEEVIAFGMRSIQAEVRKALKRADQSGLPFAGQTTNSDDTGAAVWSQRAFWLYDDYDLNVRESMTHIRSMYTEAVKLADECEDRFGRRPSTRLPDDAEPLSGVA